MQIALLVVVLLALAVLAYLLVRLRSLGVRERALRAELAALDPAAVLPPALERTFTSGSGRVLTVEILNALELACQTAGAGQTVTLAHAEDTLQRRAML